MSEPSFCRATVPGKVMLCGEYAVLEGAPALATTVSRQLTVTAKQDTSLDGVLVTSNLWQAPRWLRQADLEAEETFAKEPLLAAVAHGMRHYDFASGRIEIASNLEPSFGIGSSSALRLGVLGAMQREAFERFDKWQAAEEAYDLQRQCQGQASGYDVATQCQGGFVRFQKRAKLVDGTESFAGASLALRLYVGGKGAPTAKVIDETRRYLYDSGRFADLFELMRDFADGLVAFAAGPSGAGWQTLRHSFVEHSTLFGETPSYPRLLMSAMAKLPGFESDWLVKPTGAGGEDAMLVLLRDEDDALVRDRLDHDMGPFGWRPLDVTFGGNGLAVELCRAADLDFKDALAGVCLEPEETVELP